MFLKNKYFGLFFGLVLIFGSFIAVRYYSSLKIINTINTSGIDNLKLKELKKTNERLLEKTKMDEKEKKAIKYMVDYMNEKNFYRKTIKLKKFYYEGANISSVEKIKLKNILFELIENSEDEKEKILLAGTIKKMNRFEKNEITLNQELMKKIENKVKKEYGKKIAEINFNPFTFDIINGEFINTRVPMIGEEK